MIRSRWMWARMAGVALFLALSGVGHALVAQDPDRSGSSDDRERLEQRFRTQMNRMLKEQLGLTDGEMTRLMETLHPFDERRRALGREERSIRRETDDFIVRGDADEATAEALLTRLGGLRVRESALFQEEQDALLGMLTPLQVLQLHSFREQMGERIRQLRGRGDDDGRRRRPGGDQPGLMIPEDAAPGR